jgi:hypothetical protein
VIYFKLLTKMDSVRSRESAKNVKFKSETVKANTTLHLSEDANHHHHASHQHQQPSTLTSPSVAQASNTMVTVSMSSGGSGPTYTTVSLANANQQPQQQLVKPSQLGLKTIIKPANVVAINRKFMEGPDADEEDERRYLEMASGDKFNNSVDLDKIVWPTLRKKLMKNNTMTTSGITSSLTSPVNIRNNNVNNNDDEENLNSPGADFYDNQDVKVTVL